MGTTITPHRIVLTNTVYNRLIVISRMHRLNLRKLGVSIEDYTYFLTMKIVLVLLSYFTISLKTAKFIFISLLLIGF